MPNGQKGPTHMPGIFSPDLLNLLSPEPELNLGKLTSSTKNRHMPGICQKRGLTGSKAGQMGIYVAYLLAIGIFVAYLWGSGIYVAYAKKAGANRVRRGFYVA